MLVGVLFGLAGFRLVSSSVSWSCWWGGRMAGPRFPERWRE